MGEVFTRKDIGGRKPRALVAIHKRMVPDDPVRISGSQVKYGVYIIY